MKESDMTYQLKTVMFTAALRKQPRCSVSVNRGMNKEVVVHIYSGILVIKKNEFELGVVR